MRRAIPRDAIELIIGLLKRPECQHSALIDVRYLILREKEIGLELNEGEDNILLLPLERELIKARCVFVCYY